MHELKGMKQLRIWVGSGTNKGVFSILIRSYRSVGIIGKGLDMRGSIKLFTLSIDLRQGHRFEVAGYEKIDRSITDGISAILDQAPGLNA